MRSRSKPRTSSRAGVVAESAIATSTPVVPLATIDAAASSPSRYRVNGPASTVAPLPKKGMSAANATKGTSMVARRRTVANGMRDTAITAASRTPNQQNACHRAIGVATPTVTNPTDATIFRCAGRRCAMVWRCRKRRSPTSCPWWCPSCRSAGAAWSGSR